MLAYFLARASAVRVRLLPSCLGEAGSEFQYLTSFVIDDRVAIDGGSLGFFETPTTQAGIKHLVVSHSHLDHIASISVLLENIYAEDRAALKIHATRDVIDALEGDVLNDRLWPSLERMHDLPRPMLELVRIEPGHSFQVEGLSITPIEVDHAVPTVGFIVEDAHAAVVFSSDTGPTDELWDRAKSLKNLRAIFLEATFPNRMKGLAAAAKHLTPELFGRELSKLDRDVAVFAVHIKAKYRREVIEELQALKLGRLEVMLPGKTYEF